MKDPVPPKMPTDTFAGGANRHYIDHSLIQRPVSQRNGGGQQPRNPGSELRFRAAEEWRNNNSIIVKVRDLRPEHQKTFFLWETFSRYGGLIVFIEIFENRNGKRDGNARIRFSPPPNDAFWAENGGRYPLIADNGREYVVRLEMDSGKSGKVRSPISHTYYEQKMQLRIGKINFGIMMDPSTMMPLHCIEARYPGDIIFEVDLQRLRINVLVPVHFWEQPRPGDVERNKLNRTNRFMFQVPFAALKGLKYMDVAEDSFALVMSLDSPPRVFRQRQETQLTHSEENLTWSEFDTWFRQTDIVHDPFLLKKAKIALHKERPRIDIGRWTTYVFDFSKGINGEKYKTVKQVLQDFNIPIETVPKLKKEPPRVAELWSLINPPTGPGADLQVLQGGSQALYYLPFEVRYQLEVCISQELLNEYNLSEPFVAKLAQIASEDPETARNILEWVASDRNHERIYDPMSLFENPDALSYSVKTEIPHYCAYARKATITPTTVYLNSPTVETTNRILRHYARENLDGRFLRVQFTDEQAEGRINACAEKSQNDELFTRVFRTLANGIQIGDRHYQFLAFGNSQFRENGAYFFCETDHLTCEGIRQWMGNFKHIGVVAKYAARLGQCFSTTRAINGLSKPDIVIIPDVEIKIGEKTYNFTDGVGKISPFLAQMIAAELGIRSHIPSAFQFRLGGCKGVLATWSEAKEKEVHIRASQQKFTAVYNGLEIIRCSRFSLATLNRQTITILSCLGVEDKVFLKMLADQLANYQTAMENDEVAISLLLRYIDDNQMTINIATMLRNGFHGDPFVSSLLHLWRAWSIKLLKEKAKIIVEDGAFLLGCADETNTLKGYKTESAQPGEQYLMEELPQIFLQVPDKTGKYVVIEGVCLVGRNPSLHPGDLRVVMATDVPALYHLRDVVVFPMNGDRDIPSMCSGGDLDGDDFFVIWDKNLMPKEWNCIAMNYQAPKPIGLRNNRAVEMKDVIKFFVTFMKNDSLPTIAHAHLAQSDFLDDSVQDLKCLELAALHSKAVDYVKTGQPAVMPKTLRPTKWPHFMEKRHKPKEAIYESKKILGQLYDRVEMVSFVPQYEQPFDKRILRAYELDDAMLKTVRQVKCQYDTAMKRLMAQQEIKTEFEIWSTFVLSKPRVGSDYKIQEEIARLSDAIKAQFRAICIGEAGGSDFTVLGPFVAGMYKVTKEEMDIALNECRGERILHDGQRIPKRKMEPKYMPLMSFPWLFEKELGRIATGEVIEEEDLDMPMPVPGRKTKRRTGPVDVEDFVQQEDGVIVHRGEVLDLFNLDDSDDFADGSDFEDNQSEHGLTTGENGEVILATGFKPFKSPEHELSGTGVEDVVPQVPMDGFTDLREDEGWQLAQFTGSSSQSPVLTDDSATESPFEMVPPISRVNSANARSHSHDLAELERDVEEIMVELDLGRESSEDKLSRLTAADAPSSKAQDPDPIEVEEETVKIDLGRMSVEDKLSRLAAADTSSPQTHDFEPTKPEEEIVELDLGRESIADKLSRLTAGEEHETERLVEVEEEIIHLDLSKESIEDKLARLENESVMPST